MGLASLVGEAHLKDNVGEGVEIVLRHADAHAAVGEADPVERHLPVEHRVDVNDTTHVSVLVWIWVILSQIVRLELGHVELRQGLPLGLPVGLPSVLPLELGAFVEVNVNGEGEAIVMHRVDIPVHV